MAAGWSAEGRELAVSEKELIDIDWKSAPSFKEGKVYSPDQLTTLIEGLSRDKVDDKQYQVFREEERELATIVPMYIQLRTFEE